MFVLKRMCIACRKKGEKKLFFRLVKKGDDIIYDKAGKMDGRGAYICKSDECIALAHKKSALGRAFRSKCSNDIFDVLTKELNKNE